MSSDLSHRVQLPSNRPCSLLVPHHGWIGTAPGCLACEERHGTDYWRPVGGSEKGCCTECGGSGHSGDEDTAGRCWDCRGTGHDHDGPCVPAGGSEETKEDLSSSREATDGDL